MKRGILAGLTAVIWAADAVAGDIYTEHYGKIETTFSAYPNAPTTAGQHRNFAAAALKPGFLVESGDLQFVFEPRLRFGDSGAGVGDLRETTLSTRTETMDLMVGTSILFWGQTESYNPVDIINSYDYTHGLSKGEKLGAPILSAAMPLGIGELEIIALPRFVENRYPGAASRHRLGLLIANDKSIYSANAERNDAGGALRWTGYMGDLDLGLSYFSGTGRDPRFIPQLDGRFVPDYSKITQTGIDLQYLAGDTAFKAELINRTGQYNRHGIAETYQAGVIGLEHNIYAVFDSDYDMAVIAEYAGDGRGTDSHSGFQNDLVGGVRLLLNDIDDTEIFALASRDLDYNTMRGTGKLTTRMTDNLVLEGEVSVVSGLQRDPGAAAFYRDDYAAVTVTYAW